MADNLTTASNEVIKRLPSGYADKYSIDPITIGLIIQAILAAIQAWKDCKNPKEVVEASRVKSTGNRVIVRRQVRKQLGLKKFLQCGEEVTSAILEAGVDATPDEIEALLQ